MDSWLSLSPNVKHINVTMKKGNIPKGTHYELLASIALPEILDF